MNSLLIRNIKAIVTCDEKGTIYEDADLYVENGLILSVGTEIPEQHLAGKDIEILDGTGMFLYPGLVNAHHHLYQVFSRNLPKVQNLELFDWLKALYEVWKNLNEDTVRLSSLVGMGELLKNGCTTVFDHHYVFPEGAGDLLASQMEAARQLGVRMHFSRGSMDLSVKDGGLPPDSVVQSVDEIMKDSERLIDRYQDASFQSMSRIALAPCSPFSVSADLLRESARLARDRGVRLHTHLCETRDEEHYTLAAAGLYGEPGLAWKRCLVCAWHSFQRGGDTAPGSDRDRGLSLPGLKHETLLRDRQDPPDALPGRSAGTRGRRERVQ